MDVPLTVMLSVSFVAVIYFMSRLIGGERCGKQRHKIIDLWVQMPMAHGSRAHAEYQQVSYDKHARVASYFGNYIQLYGPLTQDAYWQEKNGGKVSDLAYDEFWWRCYNEIYLCLGPGNKSRLNKLYCQNRNLFLSLRKLGYDPYDIFGEGPHDACRMTAGAEEYDAIMAAQDIMSPQEQDLVP